MKKPVVICSSDVMGETLVVAEARVPVQIVIDYFEGASLSMTFSKGVQFSDRNK